SLRICAAALGPRGDSSKMIEVMAVVPGVQEIAERAAGENFPVGSVLFPRALRPHIRALYCYARLVDELGDAYAGDRLAALDELQAQVGLTFEGEPSWPVLRNVQPTIRAFDLPREPFLRLIEANRMDQRISEYATWDDVRWYCVHSADPCARLVLGVPRDLELGRVYMPREDRMRFGDPALDRPSEELRALLRFEAERARTLLRSG